MNNLITERTEKILKQIPPGVEAVAAVKTRTIEEVEAALLGGIRIIGHNYVQEAGKMFLAVGNRARWHLIGRLQGNKVKKAVRIFDMIETVDSLKLMESIEKHSARDGVIMPCLIQINIAGEKTKAGILPSGAERLIRESSSFRNVRIEGLMTIEPAAKKEDEQRGHFRSMKSLFEELKNSNPANAPLKYLSMGMSQTYMTAIEEGANLVRIGTSIFGPRR